MSATHDQGIKPIDVAVGDSVYINLAKKLDSGYTSMGIANRKLGRQRVGPFKVKRMVGTNAAELELPKKLKELEDMASHLSPTLD